LPLLVPSPGAGQVRQAADKRYEAAKTDAKTSDIGRYRGYTMKVNLRVVSAEAGQSAIDGRMRRQAPALG
jgi:hypothetical protein